MTTSLSAEIRARQLFAAEFGEASDGGRLVAASAPGRVELAGNHTDHQGGRTLSAAIDRRVWTLAAPNGTDRIRVVMEGFGEAELDCHCLDAREQEQGTSLSLIRGMAAAHAAAGHPLGGFNMAVASDIPAGSGVSSSAAFEMLLGVAIHALFCDGTEPDPVALALDGMRVEQRYFGKPCGAQDQLASTCGGVVALDFKEPVPQVNPVAFNAEAFGYALCLIDSRCDHSAYTDEFAAVANDMFAVARFFGASRLEDVPYWTFLQQLGAVRSQLGDRKALRAMHYYEETRRVVAQQKALATGDVQAFLEGVRASGASSAQFLQNVSPQADGTGAHQPAMIILALCNHLLNGYGACRIHGGGFGGSVLAFVPKLAARDFADRMNQLLGYDACMFVQPGQPGARAERAER